MNLDKVDPEEDDWKVQLEVVDEIGPPGLDHQNRTYQNRKISTHYSIYTKRFSASLIL
jgi:hypothetical protein